MEIPLLITLKQLFISNGDGGKAGYKKVAAFCSVMALLIFVIVADAKGQSPLREKDYGGSPMFASAFSMPKVANRHSISNKQTGKGARHMADIYSYAPDFNNIRTTDPVSLSYYPTFSFQLNQYFGNITPDESTVAPQGYGSAAFFAAAIVNPVKMVVDTAGNRYGQGANLNELSKYPADGGPVVTISHPYQKIIDMAVNTAGDLFGIAVDGTVFKLPAGSTTVQTIIAGGNSFGGIAIDSKGTIYISDTGNGALHIYDANGNFISNATSGLSSPKALTADIYDNIYISVDGDNKVLKYIPANHAAYDLYLSETFAPVSMAKDPSGYIYLVNANGSVLKLGSGGEEIGTVYSGGTGEVASFGIDGKGNAYIGRADIAEYWIMKPSGGYYLNKPLPAGVTFDNTNGWFSGRPAVTSPLITYTVTGYNGSESATATLSIKVTSGDAYMASVSADSADVAIGYIDNQELQSRVPSNVSAINLTPVTRDSTSVISYNGITYPSRSIFHIPLSVGNNMVTLLVTATGGTTREYSINFIKAAPPSVNYGSTMSFSLNQYSFFTPTGTIPNGFQDLQPYGDKPVYGRALGSKLPKMVVDTAGNRYFGNPNIQQIYKYGPVGDAFTTISTAPENGIIDLAVDRAGNLFGLSNANIFKIPAGGNSIEIIAPAPAKNALTVDLDGNIFVADSLNKKIIKYEAGSYSATDFVSTGDDAPAAVAFNGTDKLYVTYNTESGYNIVTIPTSGGTLTGVVQQYYPGRLTVSPSGLIYVTNINRVFNFSDSPSPAYSSVFYNTDAINAVNFGIDAKGIGYVADTKTGTYRKLTPKAGYYLNKPLPKGLVFNVNNGSIQGIPTEQFSPTTYTVTAYNNAEAASTSFTLSVQAPSAGLGAIYSSVGTVSPRVSPDVTEYTILVDAGATQTELTFKATDKSASITVDGDPISLKSPYVLELTGADQVLTVQVTPAEGGKGKRYKVTIHQPSSESRLGSIFLKGGVLSPDFDKDVTTYQVNLPASVTNTSINASLLASTGKITINGMDAVSGSPFRLPLKDGVNPVVINCLSEDNSTQTTYTVNITKASSATGPALSSFYSSAGTLSPAFDPDVTEYTLNLPNSESSLSFTLNVADAGSVITNNGNTIPANTPTVPVAIPVGTITFAALVTATDGSSRTYTIAVTRAAASSNSHLSSLVVSTGLFSPDFDPEVTDYALTLAYGANDPSLTFNVEDAGATINFNGGSIAANTPTPTLNVPAGPAVNFPVTVTAANGSTKTYNIAATRTPASTEATLSDLQVTNTSFGFSSGTTSYSATTTAQFVAVKAFLTDAKAELLINNNSNTSGSYSSLIALSLGTNTIVVKVTAEDGITTKTYTVTITRTISSIADLSALNTSAGSISPATFDKDVLSYSAAVASNVTSATLTAKLTDPNATLTVNGIATANSTTSLPVALAVGTNIIPVKVVAQDGITTKTYNITITRATPSTNTTLTSLSISPGSLTRVGTTNTFTASVANAVAAIAVTTTTTDPTATIKVNGTLTPQHTASGAVELAVGENTVIVEITAADGITKRRLTLQITRALSVNTDLASITITAAALSRLGTTSTYTATVTNSASTVAVTTTTIEPTATIKVNGVACAQNTPSAAVPLAIGNNTISVLITAPDGTAKTYTLAITRDARSDNANLAGLDVSKSTLTPLFAEGITDYTINTHELDVEVTPYLSDAAAGVKVNGMALTGGKPSSIIPLAPGENNIQVEITAVAGNTKTYNIVITRTASSVASLSSLSTSAGVLSPATFDKDVLDYAITVAGNVTSTIFTANVTDTYANLTVNGVATAANTASAPVALAIGANTIPLKVTAQDGSTIKTYNVTVTRVLSDNLAGLTVSDGELDKTFNKDSLSYTVILPNGTSTIQITPTSIDPSAVITAQGGAITLVSGMPKSFVLHTFNNLYQMVVTASNGAAKTYNLNIYVQASANAILTNLVSTGLTLSPAFDPAQHSYMATVGYDKTSVALTATAANVATAIGFNNQFTRYSGQESGEISLKVGLNTIPVYTTAEDGTTHQTYTLLITREASANANLAGIDVANAVFNQPFEQGVTDYTATIGNGNAQTTFIPTPQDTTATVKVNDVFTTDPAYKNVYDLSVGPNVFTVVVTAQNAVTNRTYTVTVVRAKSSNAELSGLTANLGTYSPFAGYAQLNITVPANTNSLKLTPTAAGPNAKITVNGITATSGQQTTAIALTGATTIIQLVVTAEDGITVREFKVNVIRASSNTSLAGLKINPGTLTRIGTTNTWTATVVSTVNSLTVLANATDSGATIKVNGVITASNSYSSPLSLVSGLNEISVDIIAADGMTKRKITLLVTRALSSNTGLSSLTAKQCRLIRIGTSNIWTAAVSNAIGYIEIITRTVDSTATIKVNGMVSAQNTPSAPVVLTTGDNNIVIEITAADGVTKRILTLSVNRALSSNVGLVKLSTSAGLLRRVGTTFTWTSVVTYSHTVIAVTTITSDPNATVKVNGLATAQNTPSADVPLIVGLNSIPVEITAEDGVTKRTLNIEITRAPSTNTGLAGLKIDQGSLARVSGTDTFTATVSTTVSATKVKVSTTDSTATVTVNGEPTVQGTFSGPVSLSIGINTITAVITAPDGVKTRLLTLNIIRESPPVIALTSDRQTPVGVIQRNDADINSQEDLLVKQALSPNGDGVNDRFTIEGIDLFPENTVRIMNRNGDVIYQAKGYDNLGQSFDGHSSKGTLQQPGTYFYSIEYKAGGKTKRKTGYLVIKY